jgi:23S rRNA (guanine745-N1)-methyltransferase
MTLEPPRCSPITTLACPIDGAPMQRATDGGLRCDQGHSFDRAREGYTNLLVVQHKASRDPGDSQTMVAARRRILDAGHYAPIAARTTEIALRLAATHSAPYRILDAGCGDGTTLTAIAQAANAASSLPLQLAGVDISKWAIQVAAKRGKHCFWAVASNRHLPFMPESIDLILSMFGFPLWDAFAAVQPSDGRVLLVDPGPDHLIELRSIIYPTIKPSTATALDAATAAGYTLTDEQRIRFVFELPSTAAIADLLSMTPHDHRAPFAGREALARLDQLTLTGDIVFRTLKRSG